MNNVYHFDGFLKGRNSVTKKGGFTVFKNGKLLIEQNVSGDKVFTNNEAELLGCWYCCKCAEPNSELVTDSMNTIAWVKRGASKARPDLNPIMIECKKLIAEKKLNLYWRPRAENQAGNYNEFEK